MSHDTKAKGLNVEFWAGQIFTLVATIIGVYLAANSGFNKAIEFDSLQRQRDAYFVQRALYNEFKTNLDSVQVWTQAFNDNAQNNRLYLDKDKYQFSFFLWETMQEGSSIFAVPYDRVEVIASFYERASHLRGVMFSENPFESPKAAKELEQLAESIRTDFLPSFEASIEKIKDNLNDNGLSI